MRLQKDLDDTKDILVRQVFFLSSMKFDLVFLVFVEKYSRQCSRTRRENRWFSRTIKWFEFPRREAFYKTVSDYHRFDARLEFFSFFSSRRNERTAAALISKYFLYFLVRLYCNFSDWLFSLNSIMTSFFSMYFNFVLCRSVCLCKWFE